MAEKVASKKTPEKEMFRDKKLFIVLGFLAVILAIILFFWFLPYRQVTQTQKKIRNFKIAQKLFSRGAFEEAEKRLESAKSQDPKDSRVRYLLGLTYEAQGKLKEAQAELVEALKSAPEDSEARYRLAVILKTLGKTREAERELKSIIKRDRNFLGAHFLLAELYLTQNKLDQAIEEYQTVLKLSLLGSANVIVSRNRLAQVYLKQGKTEEAIREWEMVLRADPNNKEAQENLSLHRK